MEDWSVIYKCGARDGIRGMCKAIWCGTVTDGVKGIICDVRACAFYKDPLCTEGPSARIRPIAIGCALRRLCCKAGTCDLAPEWNRFYTTMHPDDAAEWEADICSAEAALSHAKQAEAHAAAVTASKHAVEEAAPREVKLKEPRNFVRNNVFAKAGCERTAYHVRSWMESPRCKDDIIIDDDIECMYNATYMPRGDVQGAAGGAALPAVRPRVLGLLRLAIQDLLQLPGWRARCAMRGTRRARA